MKLIIEKIGEELYVYRENEKHFKKIEKRRGTPLKDLSIFDEECSMTMHDDFHVVVDMLYPIPNSRKRKV